jgi:hypothetical protein
LFAQKATIDHDETLRRRDGIDKKSRTLRASNDDSFAAPALGHNCPGQVLCGTGVVASRRNAGEAVQSLAAQCNADGDGNERGETEQRNQENRGADYAERGGQLVRV